MTLPPILLVEDNADDVELTRIALEENRIANEVVVARSGDEALAILADGVLRPAIVLLDLKLPRVSGIEVLRALRANPSTRLTPVIVMTSSDEERDLIESYSLGANSYVRKPVAYEEFVTAVRQLGIYWLLINVAPPAPEGTTA